MGSYLAHRDLRSDLPSWFPDWSVAGRGNDVLFQPNGRGWQACGTNELVFSRPSRITLALKGLVVSRLKSRSDPMDKCADRGPVMPWFEHGKNLCAFFKLQGLELDHISNGTIFRIFERILSPQSLKARLLRDISRESRLLFHQIHLDGLVALLAPVYLAAVDPDLSASIGLDIDARVPLEDYPKIQYALGQELSLNGDGARLFVTENDMQGVGYPGLQESGLVCIICDSDAPQILRQVQSDDEEHYVLVGSCIVDGLMYGEGFEIGLTERESILV